MDILKSRLHPEIFFFFFFWILHFILRRYSVAEWETYASSARTSTRCRVRCRIYRVSARRTPLRGYIDRREVFQAHLDTTVCLIQTEDEPSTRISRVRTFNYPAHAHRGESFSDLGLSFLFLRPFCGLRVRLETDGDPSMGWQEQLSAPNITELAAWRVASTIIGCCWASVWRIAGLKLECGRKKYPLNYAAGNIFTKIRWQAENRKAKEGSELVSLKRWNHWYLSPGEKGLYFDTRIKLRGPRGAREPFVQI